jgi:hypothetical protein
MLVYEFPLLGVSPQELAKVAVSPSGYEPLEAIGDDITNLCTVGICLEQLSSVSAFHMSNCDALPITTSHMLSRLNLNDHNNPKNPPYI